MNIPMLDLKRQYTELKSDLEPKILNCLRSGQYIMGKPVEKLEEDLAKYLHVRHAITVGNGTDAILLSLRAIGIGPGDEVITSPFTFFATAEAIAFLGATPVFADVDPVTYNLDPESTRTCITPRTKAILPVHIFGHPADMLAFKNIAKEHHLALVEDACQAIGASIGGKKAGTFGDIGCFSFFPTKNLGGFGDGGLITTDDDRYATIIRAMRTHGGGRIGAEAYSLLKGKPLPNTTTNNENPLYNPYKYYNYLIGTNSRLDTLQAIILRGKLPHLNDWNAARAKNAAFYCRNIQRKDVVLPLELKGYTHVWHQFVLRTSYKEQMGTFLADKGISTGVFYPVPLHLQKAFEYLKYQPGSLPEAEKLAKETLCLPVFPELTEDELQYITQAVDAFTA
ncbi:MAG TPA: transcriptional regulator [Ruminococcaceae bacterium]|nr:transcriptional regulator [Oscillospiraceae bacterium]